jgi:hypothetical protein
MATTMLSKAIPRAAFSEPFFSGLHRKGFTFVSYATVCRLSSVTGRMRSEGLKPFLPPVAALSPLVYHDLRLARRGG